MLKTYNLSMLLLLIGGLWSIPHYSSAECGAGETPYSYCYGFGETDAVVFEVCPTAGMLANAEITAGTFDDFFGTLVSLSVYQGASGSTTTGTLVFGPANGDVSDNPITATVPLPEAAPREVRKAAPGW